MRDRIEAVGGELTIATAPGRGTRIAGVVATASRTAASTGRAGPAAVGDEAAAAARDAHVGARAAPLPPAQPTIYERRLPATPDVLRQVRRELHDALERHGVPGAERSDIALAVTEAATNVVVHAYGCLASGPLYAAAALSGRSVALLVADCGNGMRDVSEEPGLGAGISLMGRLADTLRIGAAPAGPGTRVWMLFRHVTPEREPLAELLHDGVPARCDADVLHEYVEDLRAGGAPCDDAFAMLDEARRALEHAKRLRRRGWVQ